MSRLFLLLLEQALGLANRRTNQYFRVSKVRGENVVSV